MTRREWLSRELANLHEVIRRGQVRLSQLPDDGLPAAAAIRALERQAQLEALAEAVRCEIAGLESKP